MQKKTEAAAMEKSQASRRGGRGVMNLLEDNAEGSPRWHRLSCWSRGGNNLRLKTQAFNSLAVQEDQSIGSARLRLPLQRGSCAVRAAPGTGTKGV